MKLMAGIMGKDKVVEVYCEKPVTLKDNGFLNWPFGIYLDKRNKPYDMLIVVKSRMPT